MSRARTPLLWAQIYIVHLLKLPKFGTNIQIFVYILVLGYIMGTYCSGLLGTPARLLELARLIKVG